MPTSLNMKYDTTGFVDGDIEVHVVLDHVTGYVLTNDPDTNALRLYYSLAGSPIDLINDAPVTDVEVIGKFLAFFKDAK